MRRIGDPICEWSETGRAAPGHFSASLTLLSMPHVVPEQYSRHLVRHTLRLCRRLLLVGVTLCLALLLALALSQLYRCGSHVGHTRRPR